MMLSHHVWNIKAYAVYCIRWHTVNIMNYYHEFAAVVCAIVVGCVALAFPPLFIPFNSYFLPNDVCCFNCIASLFECNFNASKLYVFALFFPLYCCTHHSQWRENLIMECDNNFRMIKKCFRFNYTGMGEWNDSCCMDMSLMGWQKKEKESAHIRKEKATNKIVRHKHMYIVQREAYTSTKFTLYCCWDFIDFIHWVNGFFVDVVLSLQTVSLSLSLCPLLHRFALSLSFCNQSATCWQCCVCTVYHASTPSSINVT